MLHNSYYHFWSKYCWIWTDMLKLFVATVCCLLCVYRLPASAHSVCWNELYQTHLSQSFFHLLIWFYWLNCAISCLCRKRWPCVTDTLLLLPSTRHRPPTPCPVWVSVQPAVDWSALIEGFARWFFGLAPPPPGAGVRSQQPVVPCAPPSPSLHTRAHAQGKTRTRTHLIQCGGRTCELIN